MGVERLERHDPHRGALQEPGRIKVDLKVEDVREWLARKVGREERREREGGRGGEEVRRDFGRGDHGCDYVCNYHTVRE